MHKINNNGINKHIFITRGMSQPLNKHSRARLQPQQQQRRASQALLNHNQLANKRLKFSRHHRDSQARRPRHNLANRRHQYTLPTDLYSRSRARARPSSNSPSNSPSTGLLLRHRQPLRLLPAASQPHHKDGHKGQGNGFRPQYLQRRINRKKDDSLRRMGRSLLGQLCPNTSFGMPPLAHRMLDEPAWQLQCQLRRFN
jgi:hypothetical protein